jgi:hypothetical protein
MLRKCRKEQQTTLTVLSTPTSPEPLQHVCYVIFQFSWLRYHTQVLPIAHEELRRMNTAMAWFVWNNSICPVPLSTVRLSPRQGGRGLLDVTANCITWFFNRCIRHIQRDATLTAEWNRTIAPVSLPSIRSVPAGLNYLRLLFREICYIPSYIFFLPPEGHGAANYMHICDFLERWCRWFESLLNVHMPSGQLFGKTSPAPRCMMIRDLRGTGLYTAWHPRRYDNTTSAHRTRGCVSSVTYRHTTAQTHTAHCHLRNMAMATSQVSCSTAYGPQICPPTVASVPWCHRMDENKKVTRRYDDRTRRSLCCAEWQFCHPTWLHDFLRRASKKAE